MNSRSHPIGLHSRPSRRWLTLAAVTLLVSLALLSTGAGAAGTPAPAACDAPAGPSSQTDFADWRYTLPMMSNDDYPGTDLRIAGVAGSFSGWYDDSGGIADAIIVSVANYGTEPITDEFWVDLYIEPDSAPTGPNQRWQDLCYYGAQWGITADYLPLDPGEYLLLGTSQISVASVSDGSTSGLRAPEFILPTESRIPSVFGATLDVYAQADSVDTRTDYGAVLEYHEELGLPTNNITHGFFPNQRAPLALGANTTLTAVPAGTFVDEPPRE